MREREISVFEVKECKVGAEQFCGPLRTHTVLICPEWQGFLLRQLGMIPQYCSKISDL